MAATGLKKRDGHGQLKSTIQKKYIEKNRKKKKDRLRWLRKKILVKKLNKSEQKELMQLQAELLV